MTTPHKDHLLTGMACAATAYFMLSMMAVFSKILSHTYNVVEVSFYRNAIAALPFLFFVFVLGKRDVLKIRQKPFLLILRCVLGTFSLMLTFATFSLLPLAEATVLLFTSSLFMPILSRIFLKEHISSTRMTAIAAGMIGVLIMARPTGDANMVGIAVGLTTAVCHAVLGTILRHLGKSESPTTVTFYFVCIGAVMSAVPLPFMGSIPKIDTLPLIIGLGMTGAAGQFFLSNAFRFAPAAIVTVFNYTGIIWATLFGWWLWNDWPTFPVWVGGTIIITSNIFMLLREKYLLNRAQDEARQLQQEEKLS